MRVAGAAEADTLQLVAVSFVTIGEAAAISVGACLLATVVPLGFIAKVNIVESIENAE